jgi:multidrug resistance protein, MATE family
MVIWLKELRATMALAVPIALGQVGQMLIGITDTLMIGRLGTVPLAGAAFVGAVFGVVFVACIGLLQPVSVMIARAHGAGRIDEGGAWLRAGRRMAWIAAGGLMAALLAANALRAYFGQPPEVVAIMGPYFTLCAVSLVPALIFQADRQAAEATGRPWTPAAILLAGVLLNVVLNWILIYGRFGAPALGLTGAGWATLLARAAVALALRAWLGHQAVGAAARTARPPMASGRTLWRLGLPMAAALGCEAGAFSMAAVMAGWLGTVPLAAHQIAIACTAFTFMTPLGLALALGVRVATLVGEGRRADVRAAAFGALGLTLAVMVVFTTGYATLGGRIAGWFVEDAAVIALTARCFVVVAVFQLVDGVQVVSAGALRGLTDVRVPTAVAIGAYWGVALPIGYLWGVRGEGGLVAIWTLLAAGLALAAAALVARLAWLTRAPQPGPR